MRRLGQHFLKNRSIAKKIVAALDLRPDETVIEIGPGHGELTVPLLEAAGRIGATVLAIERDSALVPALAERATGSSGRLLVIEGDALAQLPDVVRGIKKGKSGAEPAAPYVLAGNIPYYITGKLLRTVGELEHKPRIAALMVQKEVAERICAAPPSMNRLAASIQFWAEPTIIATVPREDFSPPPEVDSAVILLCTRTAIPAVAPVLYYKSIRGIFAQPRKTILNNALALMANGGKKDRAAAALAKIGIDPNARPQDLGIDQLIAIAASDFGDNRDSSPSSLGL